jgi:membrane protease YdiL (CAAX protease family)
VRPADIENEIFTKREAMERVLREKQWLGLIMSLATLLIITLFLLGIVIDTILASAKLAGRRLDIRTLFPRTVRWGIADVLRVVILFLSFAYTLIVIEAFLAGVFPILKNDNFRMVLDSTILDILCVALIAYFTIGKYKEDLAALGLSLKNLARNVFYGIAGYIATVPILIAVLVIITTIINITKYVPQKQPIVELFLKEENATFLAYTSLFAAVAGPLMEELFFRGFMYNAFKKAVGIFWATLVTSAVFAALHSNVVGFLPIMVIGITLTYLYERTGTLVSSITLHIIHNLNMVFLVFMVKQARF